MRLTFFRYGNQVEVAEGLRKAFKEIPGLKREDVFIVRFVPLRFQFQPLTVNFHRRRSCGIGTSTPLLATRTLTNLVPSQHRPEIVEAALDDCLKELGLDYLDVS